MAGIMLDGDDIAACKLGNHPETAYKDNVPIASAMAINALRNRQSGPGGSARRLHHTGLALSQKGGDATRMGANQDRRM